MTGRSVVITGIGMVTPAGVGTQGFWENALNGASAVAPIPDHWKEYFQPCSLLWAPLPGIDFAKFDIGRTEQLQLDKVALIALVAAREALLQAGLTFLQIDPKKNTFCINDINAERWGVFIGTGIGGISTLGTSQAFHWGDPLARRLDEVTSELTSRPESGELPARLESARRSLRMPMRFNPMTVAMIMPNSCSSSIGIKYGLTGPNLSYTTACAAGTTAIGSGYQAIVSGECDAAVVGGAEFLGDDYGCCFRGFDCTGTLVRNCDDPAAANRPFDRDRSGFLFAEGGAAVLVIEEKVAALKRGAPIVAEIAGYGASFDAFSNMALEPSGKSAERMIRTTLTRAGVEPADVDYINSHGTGTRQNDEIESSLVERIFGPKPLVNSTKSLTGHTLGASGAIEAAVTALTIRNQAVHVSKNIADPIRSLNFARESQTVEVECALTQSFGFGGHNACLVMKRAG